MQEFQFYSLEWLGGFFDGEGSITIGKDKYVCKDGSQGYRLIVQLVQKNKPLLTKLKKLHGGCICVHGAGSYTLRLEAGVAERFLQNIFPYLRLKQYVALLALDFRKLMGDKYRRKTGKGRQYLKSTWLKQERLRRKIMRINAKD